MRILVLASESIGADDLRAAVGDDAAEAEVLVIAPALQDSALRFWMSDADAAIERARIVQKNSVRKLRADDVDASGDTGESEPLDALHDTMTEFDPDQIVVFRHPDGEFAHGEDALASDLQARFDVPLTTRIVDR